MNTNLLYLIITLVIFSTCNYKSKMNPPIIKVEKKVEIQMNKNNPTLFEYKH